MRATCSTLGLGLGLGLGLALACAASVRADALPVPPEDCPRGSIGETSHAGTRCEASICSGDADCGAGRVCRSVALCVREVEATFDTYSERPARETFAIAMRECGGGPSECPPDAAAHLGWRGGGGRDVTEASSDQTLRVTGPARCVTELRCVREPAPSTPTPTPTPTSTPTSTPTPTQAAPEPTSGGCAASAGRSDAGIASALSVALAAVVLARRPQRPAARRPGRS